MQLLISFFNSDAGTSTITNDPNFTFTMSQWPSVFIGYLNIVFGCSSSLIQPSGVNVKLTSILNPLQSSDFNSMQLGSNAYTLPLSSDDGGQNRNFVVSNEIPSGYYLIDVSTTFNNNFNALYTGKVFIPAATTSLTTAPQQPIIISKTTVDKTKTIVIHDCDKRTTLVHDRCVPNPPSDNHPCPPPVTTPDNNPPSGGTLTVDKPSKSTGEKPSKSGKSTGD